MEISDVDEMVRIMKSLSEPARLHIVGLLARRPHVVEDLVAATGLSAPTVSHHLRRLRDAGLVASERSQYYMVYRLEQERLRELGRKLAGPPGRLLPGVEANPLDAFDRTVLDRFLVDGKLVSIPRQHKKRDAILRFLARRFEPDRVYEESEVNEAIRVFHEDVATLRRDLIASGLLERRDGRYRLTHQGASGEPTSGAGEPDAPPEASKA
jgi:biotin operon repressor